jgi:hypothetical protein
MLDDNLGNVQCRAVLYIKMKNLHGKKKSELSQFKFHTKAKPRTQFLKLLLGAVPKRKI